MGQNVNKGNSSLVAQTVALLRTHPDTMKDIALATGVNASFISRLYHGLLVGPDAHKIQKLYEYLANRKLEV